MECNVNDSITVGWMTYVMLRSVSHSYCHLLVLVVSSVIIPACHLYIVFFNTHTHKCAVKHIVWGVIGLSGVTLVLKTLGQFLFQLIRPLYNARINVPSKLFVCVRSMWPPSSLPLPARLTLVLITTSA